MKNKLECFISFRRSQKVNKKPPNRALSSSLLLLWFWQAPRNSKFAICFAHRFTLYIETNFGFVGNIHFKSLGAFCWKKRVHIYLLKSTRASLSSFLDTLSDGNKFRGTISLACLLRFAGFSFSYISGTGNGWMSFNRKLLSNFRMGLEEGRPGGVLERAQAWLHCAILLGSRILHTSLKPCDHQHPQPNGKWVAISGFNIIMHIDTVCN